MGPLRVVDEDGKYSIGARKVQQMLTVLLIRADQVVPVDQLMAELWGENPPRRANAGIHVYVSQIRKFLHRLGRSECPVITCPPGYTLRLGSDDLDLRVFQQLVTEAREHARRQRYERAAAGFESALALWHGPLIDDIYRGPILEGFQAWLEEARLDCIDMLIESQLMLGHHHRLVSELSSLTTKYPLREALHCQLMLALYRCGRRADALQAYQSARRILNAELGLDPCREMQNLQHAILTSDKQLDLCVSQL
jgi:SARP family transcriptional regulator, regulator of embCAB operon